MVVMDFMKAIDILQEYYDDIRFVYVTGDNGIIALNKTDRPLSQDSVQRMRNLGWWQNEINPDAEYDPLRSWKYYAF